MEPRRFRTVPETSSNGSFVPKPIVLPGAGVWYSLSCLLASAKLPQPSVSWAMLQSHWIEIMVIGKTFSVLLFAG